MNEINVIPFKKQRFKKKKYHKGSIDGIETFLKSCKEKKCQGFVALAWIEDDLILTQYSINTDKIKCFPMVGALESFKRKLLDIADYVDAGEI